ncbi:lantibiotic dehydratase [Mucilaginibacter sabulilitoris]|uniref:Lantibiotic dehydratase n=1 Tax=Mucilaginibacter sabulilitoris TaxID=1173583 RepID=A0ABZ0TRL5_9SPHI|nr:lantibiotic dehydratase [Mucilaginibacter sabulilitoris]WPU94793.1 lantibiotic dehydratase [Mucilaginibacter sabulilitoris]
MGIAFAPQLLLRLPAYPEIQYDQDLQCFLDDPFFRAAIFLASPVFYRSLKDCDFNTKKLTEKQRISLLKYVNRACFRPTPFGLFSSVSLLEWSNKDSIQFDAKQPFSVNISPDQSLLNLVTRILYSQITKIQRFEVNPTIYQSLKEYRFVRTEVDPEEKRQYRLQSTAYSGMLKNILKFSRQGRTCEEILAYISNFANTNKAESLDYFLFLLDAQVIVGQLRQNISGEDFLRLLTETGQVGPEWNFIFKLTGQRFNPVDKTAEYLQSIDHQVKLLQPALNAEKPAISVILERKLSADCIGYQIQSQIRDGLFALHCLSYTKAMPTMENFSKEFERHFGGQRLPLLSCFDPEQGINYQKPALESPNILLETLRVRHKETTDQNANWGSAHVYLMNRWIEAERNCRQNICLTKDGLQKLKNETQKFQTLGLSILFRRSGDKIYLESAGGTNACALLGRFTVASPEMAEAATNMAKDLEQRNLHLVFAELLHLTDPHHDNINRRKHIWSYEIPITAASTLPADQRIELRDLYVEVISGKVYLWSEALKKYVIPRLSSAYNHSLNKLPLFRFMVDLGYQYGDSDLTFDLSRFFPGLDHYPRVEYERCILSPATWVLREPDLLPLQGKDEMEALHAYRELAVEKNIPEVFLLTEADHQLRLYRDRGDDITLFLKFVRTRREIVLLEYLGNHDETSLVKDPAGRSFIAQYNTFVVPDEPIPFPVSIATNSKVPLTVRKFMPGTEWLYLKIYTPAQRMSKLLVNLWPFIRKNYHNGTIENWFFVRYEDHAPHLRLRLKTHPKNISDILVALNGLLGKQVEQHMIREYHLDTYHRELERYQAAGIALTEEFFWASSVFTIEHLQRGRNFFPPYLVAIRTVIAIAEMFISDRKVLADYFKDSYDALAAEFDGTKNRTELDLKYRELSGFIQQVFDDEAFDVRNQFGSAYKNLMIIAKQISEAVGEGDHNSYLNSILHLHMNRLFTDQQRKQEMVVYYMLYKFIKSEIARNKQGNH